VQKSKKRWSDGGIVTIQFFIKELPDFGREKEKKEI